LTGRGLLVASRAPGAPRLRRRTVARCVAPLAAAALLLACSEASRPTNLLLVSIDSLRADRLGVYGAERDTTPVMDRIAEEGALFEAAMAPTSWTLPSHVTLLTGQSIPVHGVAKPLDRLDPARITLAQQLTEAGYASAGFVSAPFLHAAYGFDRGFDVYENLGAAAAIESLPIRGRHNLASHRDSTAGEVVERAIGWLGSRTDPEVPFFLFVHLWDPHYDYDPPAPYDTLFDPDYEGALDASSYELNPTIHSGIGERDKQHLRALYDGEVRWTDAQLGRLFDALRESGALDHTLVAIVSDHGEEFFEHGRKGHDKTLFEESVRVPWILRLPGKIEAGRRVPGPVSLEDVAPTLLEVAGVAPLVEATGRSRAAQLAGAAAPPQEPVLLVHRSRTALRGPDWKVIVDGDRGRARFYDLARDPEEQSPEDARRVAPDRIEALRARLDADARRRAALHWEGGGEAPLDPATRERLRELGYLE
jgi:arylsulfatase A-like enzyme